MVPSRRRASMRGAVTQGVARGSAPAMSKRSALSRSKRSTESSGFTASETDFGSSAPGSAPAASSSTAPTPAGTAPATTPTEDLFRPYMKVNLEDRRNHAPAPAPAPPPADAWEETSERPLKARNPDLYYGNSQMEYWYFCQQFEDHFVTVGAKSNKRVPFAASVLNDRILHRWQQHKAKTKRCWPVPLSWEEFKAFLRKSLGESNAFVRSVWSQIRGDS